MGKDKSTSRGMGDGSTKGQKGSDQPAKAGSTSFGDGQPEPGSGNVVVKRTVPAEGTTTEGKTDKGNQ